MKRRTSFYLPKDAVKHLHVLSHTRAREVIEALLRKFMVVDDPRKFALFERAERHGQGLLPTPLSKEMGGDFKSSWKIEFKAKFILMQIILEMHAVFFLNFRNTCVCARKHACAHVYLPAEAAPPLTPPSLPCLIFSVLAEAIR